MSVDDLDDGLAYQVDFSNDEVVLSDDDKHMDSLSEDETKSSENPKKRSKSGSKLQEKKKMKMQMDIDKKRNLSKEASADVIADSINDGLRRKNPDLSALEMAELYFKKTDFRSTAEFTEARNLDNLPKFILLRFDNMLPSKTPGKKNKKKGKKIDGTVKTSETPDDRKFIAIITMSAIRACDVHRCLREIPGSSLKLINKNKIDVDLKLIKSTWARVLCCTPGRLQKILNNKDLGLKASEIKIVIADNSYLDQKMQNVFNISETTETLKQLTESGSKIYLY
ncbi:hypothetical protein METBIDRAFT_44837 [Metschnikowia bicuspidata var. bicuspidata NRRL YB-4993]|uniref:Protein CMS1 n=1 Tax=Metschnikowia bicuspidata var. bicuspidata NRRL YB-4993 TaxID=869754 RepID=A0A1A0H8A2_9ASCO|nr:hypothetical protein METBIDRAFT_44837 [Metschnikowia bicuspidata var. bicuspidata NRRL YB-4993]OBA20123.1 hypothetical protein METBIDRAFT_44837 [Metschnikowia bicuspidata var. bicuspidata NRRL YB-4993]